MAIIVDYSRYHGMHHAPPAKTGAYRFSWDGGESNMLTTYKSLKDAVNEVKAFLRKSNPRVTTITLEGTE